jgi:hypothetical protein
MQESKIKEKQGMCSGAEIVIALLGLWAVYLRPKMMRYAGEMAEVMGYAAYQIMRGRPSLAFSSYLPYSASFLH